MRGERTVALVAIEWLRALSTVDIALWAAVAAVAIPRLAHANGSSRIIRAFIIAAVLGMAAGVALTYNSFTLHASDLSIAGMFVTRFGVGGMAVVKLWLVRAWRY